MLLQYASFRLCVPLNDFGRGSIDIYPLLLTCFDSCLSSTAYLYIFILFVFISCIPVQCIFYADVYQIGINKVYLILS